jgi:hypothetical protein
MNLSEQDLDAIRDTASYRAALWTARAEVAVVGVWCSLPGWVPNGPRSASLPLPVIITFVTAGVLAVAAQLLLRHAGVPFRFGRIADAGALWAFCRDIFWYRRPYKLPDDWHPPR